MSAKRKPANKRAKKAVKKVVRKPRPKPHVEKPVEAEKPDSVHKTVETEQVHADEPVLGRDEFAAFSPTPDEEKAYRWLQVALVIVAVLLAGIVFWAIFAHDAKTEKPQASAPVVHVAEAVTPAPAVPDDTTPSEPVIHHHHHVNKFRRECSYEENRVRVWVPCLVTQ